MEKHSRVLVECEAGTHQSGPNKLGNPLSNPSIFNASGALLGLGGLRNKNVFARHSCTRIKVLWNLEERDWKSLSKLRMSYLASNRRCKEAITASIPWRPDKCASHPQPGEWIDIPNPNPASPLDWVYLILQSGRDTTDVIEYKRSAPGRRIQATTHQVIQLSTANYRQVRVLSQERSRSTFKVARDPPAPGKKPPLFWIYETGFVQDLPWDPGEWHWQAPPPFGDAPFFGYTVKRGYKNVQRMGHTPNMFSFIQGLNLRNSTTTQVIARIWHNVRPKKVGTLIWLPSTKASR